MKNYIFEQCPTEHLFECFFELIVETQRPMKPPLNQGKEKKTGFVLCPSTKYKSNSIRIPRILFNLWPVHEIWGRRRQRRQRRRGWGRRGRSGPPAKLSPAGEKWNFRAIKDKDALFMLFNQLDQLFRCVFFSCTAVGHHQVFHLRLEELRLFERLILCRHNAVGHQTSKNKCVFKSQTATGKAGFELCLILSMHFLRLRERENKHNGSLSNRKQGDCGQIATWLGGRER